MSINKQVMNVVVGALFCMFVAVKPSTAQQRTELSDPEVASVAVVANQIDISFAEIAKTKSKDANVLKFAIMMATDHQAVIDQASALVKKLGVTPKDNSVSQKLLKDSENTKQMLLSKSGNDFNKAYIDNEVGYHKAVISTIEGLLIPESENQELKALLQNVLPAFKTHLEHAEMLQKEMSK